MLPIFATLLSAVPGLLNTGLSLIRDKKEKETKTLTSESEGTEFVHSEIEKGVSLSSKRILNIAGTGLIITLAVNDLTRNGITRNNLILLAVGVAYSLTMAFITYLTERK